MSELGRLSFFAYLAWLGLYFVSCGLLASLSSRVSCLPIFYLVCLGRLTLPGVSCSPLFYLVCTSLLRAACIVMQPDLGVPDDASQEEIDVFLESAGIEPVPAPSRAGRAKASPIGSPLGLAQKTIVSGDMDAGECKTNAVPAPPGSGWDTTTISGNVRGGRDNINCRLDGFVWRDTRVGVDAKAGDGVTPGGDATTTAGGGSADAEAAPEEEEFNRSWLGTEVSAASTLVVLTTAMCR